MSAHIVEADFRNELGQRVMVLTCEKYRLSCIADDRGRCTHCNEVTA